MALGYKINGTQLENNYTTWNDLGAVGNNSLWGWGRNADGQLGLSDNVAKSIPTQVGLSPLWSSVSAGELQTMAIKTDKTLWAIGGGSQGELGLNNRDAISSPKQVGTLSNWEKISCGTRHTTAVKSDGTLWAWGRNYDYGQIGQESTTIQFYSSPTQVGSLTNWSKVSAGADHTLAIKTDGTLWSWGSDVFSGVLGLGNFVHRSSPTQVGSLTNWSQVSTRTQHVLAIKTNGTLWAWGNNLHGQLGMGDTYSRESPIQVGALTNWKQVSAGYRFSMAVKTDGTLWAWGDGDYDGKLGLGSLGSSNSPIQVGSLTNWSQVSCGNLHVIALKTDGTLWAWGRNSNGSLGLGDTNHRSSPVQVGSLTTWNLVAAGTYHSTALRISDYLAP